MINLTPSGVVEVALLWHKYKNRRVTQWRTATNVCMGSAFHSHINAYQATDIYYCASDELMKSWKDFFSAAGMERNICIICAGSAEKKGTSGGSRKLLIEEICLVFFGVGGGGGKRLNPTIKLQQGDQEPDRMLEHISCEMTEIVLNAVRYGSGLNRIQRWSGSRLQLLYTHGHSWTQVRDEFQHPQ